MFIATMDYVLSIWSVGSLLLEHVDVVLTVQIQFLDWNKTTLKLWQNHMSPSQPLKTYIVDGIC